MNLADCAADLQTIVCFLESVALAIVATFPADAVRLVVLASFSSGGQPMVQSVQDSRTARLEAARTRMARHLSGLWFRWAAFVLATEQSGKPMGWCASWQDKEAIARLIGGGPATAVQITQEAATKVNDQERAFALWEDAGPVPGTPAALYLERRGIGDLMHADCLRFRPDTPHPGRHRLPVLNRQPASRRPNLHALAMSLVRPVRMGWLRIEDAEVALTLAVCRQPSAADVLAQCHDLHGALRRELAA
jgi:hypothetical protein